MARLIPITQEQMEELQIDKDQAKADNWVIEFQRKLNRTPGSWERGTYFTVGPNKNNPETGRPEVKLKADSKEGACRYTYTWFDRVRNLTPPLPDNTGDITEIIANALKDGIYIWSYRAGWAIYKAPSIDAGPDPRADLAWTGVRGWRHSMPEVFRVLTNALATLQIVKNAQPVGHIVRSKSNLKPWCFRCSNRVNVEETEHLGEKLYRIQCPNPACEWHSSWYDRQDEATRQGRSSLRDVGDEDEDDGEDDPCEAEPLRVRKVDVLITRQPPLLTMEDPPPVDGEKA